jgi:hypothetical protein
MAVPDARVDAYIARASPFAQPILAALRAQVHAHCPEAEETLKWGAPHFQYRGRILCSMAAFKAHCAFGFWLGDLMGLEARASEAWGQFGRLTSADQLPPSAEMGALIREAMRLTDSGAKPPSRTAPRAKAPLEVPADLMEALGGVPEALRTFEAFAPSHRKEYVAWITEAKTPATRARRLAQAVAWMAEGKRWNWKYERC